MQITPSPLRDYPTDTGLIQTLDDEAFLRFLHAFPDRPGGHDVEAAREAFTAALRRAGPATIIAGAKAYATATAGRPARYVMSARRWIAESRWRDAAPAAARPPLIWISYGSPEWQAWRRHWIETRKKSPPIDRRGGWRFPSRWPPETPAEQRDAFQ